MDITPSPSTHLNNGSSRIKVALRIRPYSYREDSATNPFVVNVSSDHKQVIVVDGNDTRKCFSFDDVFNDVNSDPKQAQRELFSRFAENLLDYVLDGENITLFAYGQTGSGKTYSTLGTSEAPGIMPQFVEGIFSKTKSDVIVECAYMQIYNEQITDLITGSKTALRLRVDPKTGPYVPELAWKTVKSAANLLKYIQIGTLNRATAATWMNDYSSRSHAILQLKITQSKSEIVEGDKHTYTSTSLANIVDLAGSERLKGASACAGSESEQKKRGKMMHYSL